SQPVGAGFTPGQPSSVPSGCPAYRPAWHEIRLTTGATREQIGAIEDVLRGMPEVSSYELRSVDLHTGLIADCGRAIPTDAPPGPSTDQPSSNAEKRWALQVFLVPSADPDIVSSTFSGMPGVGIVTFHSFAGPSDGYDGPGGPSARPSNDHLDPSP